MHSFAPPDETMDQKTDLTKLWRTIKGIDDIAKREAQNEEITFNGIYDTVWHNNLLSKINRSQLPPATTQSWNSLTINCHILNNFGIHNINGVLDRMHAIQLS